MVPVANRSADQPADATASHSHRLLPTTRREHEPTTNKPQIGRDNSPTRATSFSQVNPSNKQRRNCAPAKGTNSQSVHRSTQDTVAKTDGRRCRFFTKCVGAAAQHQTTNRPAKALAGSNDQHSPNSDHHSTGKRSVDRSVHQTPPCNGSVGASVRH